MSLLKWNLEETPEGNIFTSDLVDGYEITQGGGKFFIHRTVSECDDIGPLDDFKRAEETVMKIIIALVEFEEKLWRVSAAMAIEVTTMLTDGSANQLPDDTEAGA